MSLKAPQPYKFGDSIDLEFFQEILQKASEFEDALTLPAFPNEWIQLSEDIPSVGNLFVLTDAGVEFFTEITDPKDGRRVYEKPSCVTLRETGNLKILVHSCDEPIYILVSGGTVEFGNDKFELPLSALLKLLPGVTYKFTEATIKAYYLTEPELVYTFVLPYRFVALYSNEWQQILISDTTLGERTGIFWNKNQEFKENADPSTLGTNGYILTGTPDQTDQKVWTFFENETYIEEAELPDGKLAPEYVYGLAKVSKDKASDKQYTSITPLKNARSITISSEFPDKTLDYELTIQNHGDETVTGAKIIEVTSEEVDTEVAKITGYVLLHINESYERCSNLGDLSYAEILIDNWPHYKRFFIEPLTPDYIARTKLKDGTIRFVFTNNLPKTGVYLIVFTECFEADEENTYEVANEDVWQLAFIAPVSDAIPAAGNFVATAFETSCQDGGTFYLGTVNGPKFGGGHQTFTVTEKWPVVLKLKISEASTKYHISAPKDFKLDVTYQDDTTASMPMDETVKTFENLKNHTISPADQVDAVVFHNSKLTLNLKPASLLIDLTKTLEFTKML